MLTCAVCGESIVRHQGGWVVYPPSQNEHDLARHRPVLA